MNKEALVTAIENLLKEPDEFEKIKLGIKNLSTDALRALKRSVWERQIALKRSINFNMCEISSAKLDVVNAVDSIIAKELEYRDVQKLLDDARKEEINHWIASIK